MRFKHLAVVLGGALLVGACGEPEPEAAPEVTNNTEAASAESTDASTGQDDEVGIRCDEYFSSDSGDEHTEALFADLIDECEREHSDGVIPQDQAPHTASDSVYEDLERWQDETIAAVLDELSPPPVDDLVSPEEDQTPDGTAWYTADNAVTQHLGEQQSEVCGYLDRQIDTAQNLLQEAHDGLDAEQRDALGAFAVDLHGAYLVFHEHLGGSGDGLPVAFAETCHGATDAWFGEGAPTS